MVISRKIILCCIMIATLFLLPLKTKAEEYKWSLGTNLIDWADLLTINLEGGFPVSRYASIIAGAKFNPWQFEKQDPKYIIQDRKIAAYVGARWWPWMVQSGWWVEGRAQYCKFDISGIWRPAVESGQAAGLGASFGYSFMINKHFNIDLGLGVWGGYAFDYTLYHCAYCQEVRESGPRWFIFPDNIKVAFVYVF